MIEFGSPQTRRSRVLVADDAQGMVSLYQKLLRSDGHEVFAASDGEAQNLVADVSRLEETLGLCACVDLEEGLKRAFAAGQKIPGRRTWRSDRRAA